MGRRTLAAPAAVAHDRARFVTVPVWSISTRPSGTTPPPFIARSARLGAQAGAEHLGASLYEIPPGGAVSPLHIHHANEELAFVISGRPTLRMLEEERGLVSGEVVAFPTGPRGAHRIENRTDEPCRVLIVSTRVSPEIVEYPDSGKVGAMALGESPVRVLVRTDQQVGYFDGEI